jgi:hypothetical protein
VYGRRDACQAAVVDRRTIVSVALGALSVACAVGAFESDPGHDSIVFEPLAEGGAGVYGVVLDAETGRRIHGALVIVQCACLPGHREMETNADGIYSFRDLPPGKYSVQVLFGQANVNRSFELAMRVRARADFRVAPEDKFIIT